MSIEHTGAVYYRFLLTDLPVLLKMCLFINDYTRSSWRHEGAPHCHSVNQTFGRQWIGRGCPVRCPARSPDLSRLDFWLWGYLMTSVYLEPISDVEVVQQAENVCREMRVKPGIF